MTSDIGGTVRVWCRPSSRIGMHWNSVVTNDVNNDDKQEQSVEQTKAEEI